MTSQNQPTGVFAASLTPMTARTQSGEPAVSLRIDARGSGRVSISALRIERDLDRTLAIGLAESRAAV